jgi:hypothetical protein
MIDSRTHQLLQDIVRRESRSLLQYVSESFPWTTREEVAALGKLQTLIKEEREAAAALGRFLLKKRLTPPYLGAYPMSFTTINYVSLEHLMPLLIEHQSAAIGELESDRQQVKDPEARGMLDNLLAMKQRHLKVLEEMATSLPAASTRR